MLSRLSDINSNLEYRNMMYKNSSIDGEYTSTESNATCWNQRIRI